MANLVRKAASSIAFASRCFSSRTSTTTSSLYCGVLSAGTISTHHHSIRLYFASNNHLYKSIAMKAVRVHAVGGPEVLQYETVDIPEPKAGEVLVKNKAAGLNYIDTYHRSGLYKMPLPFTVGREGAGEVVKLGEGVTGLSVGDRVAFSLVPGAYAEYVAFPAFRAYKLPPSVDYATGASLMLQGLTAHYLVTSTFPIHPGHSALVHAGAGGLGQLVIQMAKIRGCSNIIATVSTPEKAEICRSLGAHHVILYSSQNIVEEVKKVTNGAGVDVVYDSVGAATFMDSLNSLKPLGYLVLLGNSSGPVPPIDPLLLSEKGSLFVTRPTLYNYASDPASYTARLNEIFGWYEQHLLKLNPPISFPLGQAADAHRQLEARKTVGKVLLIPEN